MSVEIFNYIGGSINNFTNGFINNGVQNIIDVIKYPTVMGVTLYLMVKAYLQIWGKTDSLIRDTIAHCAIVICITTLSLNAVNYTTYLVGVVNAWSDGLTDAITSASGIGKGQDIYKTLDQLLLKGIDQAKACFQKMSLFKEETWDWAFSGIAVLAATIAITISASIIIIGSKFLLIMLLLIGPLFLTFACFPITRRFFDNWVSKLLENSFVQIFGIAVINLSISIIRNFISINTLGTDKVNPLAVAAQIIALIGVMLYIIRQVPNLAGSLSGSFASASLTLRDALNPAKQAMNTSKNVYAKGKEAYEKTRNWANRNPNQIHGGGYNSPSRAEMKRDQMLQDLIAEQTRKNIAKR